MPYTGRFAPSPSGPLHLGSLVAALGSWLDARANSGRWLLRIEDLDTPRNQPGAEAAILASLQAHGLDWDGAIERQSARLPLYHDALAHLRKQDHVYPCACTRRDIGDAGGRYPGTCRAGLPDGRQARAWRLACPAGTVQWVAREDVICTEDVAAVVGDFVLQRADRIVAYQLAVVVDDGAQGVTDVVRGRDLRSSTGRQRLLQDLLQLPAPRYLHLPLALGRDGQKLSKQNLAPALQDNAASANLTKALIALGQPLPLPAAPECAQLSRDALLDWAIAHWQPARLPATDEPMPVSP